MVARSLMIRPACQGSAGYTSVAVNITQDTAHFFKRLPVSVSFVLSRSVGQPCRIGTTATFLIWLCPANRAGNARLNFYSVLALHLLLPVTSALAFFMKASPRRAARARFRGMDKKA